MKGFLYAVKIGDLSIFWDLFFIFVFYFFGGGGGEAVVGRVGRMGNHLASLSFCFK